MIGKAIPIVDILTLAATGTEMNRGAVISNMVTNEKLGMRLGVDSKGIVFRPNFDIHRIKMATCRLVPLI